MMQIRDIHLGPQEVNKSCVKLLICDIDGTVADGSHRQHFVQNQPKNWSAYRKLSHLDRPIDWVIDIVNEFHYSGTKVIMCSGRLEEERKVTRDWLFSHGVLHNELFMRSNNDYRADDIVKKELLQEIRTTYGEPDLILDDRNRVVDMWRKNGYRCIQVNYGDF